jgi:biopolymer transport protein ExbB
MMKTILLLALAAAPQAPQTSAQAGEPLTTSRFDVVADDVQAQLEASLAELRELRARLAAEKVPMTRELNELERELLDVRAEYTAAKRELDTATLDLTNLTSELKSRETEVGYLDGLLGDFAREFEAGLHVAELQRYAELLEAAKLAPEDAGLSKREVLEVQARVVAAALDRIEDALGGVRFDGQAVGADGLVDEGTFVLVGPTAIFLPQGEDVAYAAEQRLGSQEPTEIAYGNPEDAAAAAELARAGAGFLPFDATLGNAHKMEEVEETFLEHVQKGGAVMWPIGVLAAAALLVAVGKWLALTFQPRPSRRKVDALLAAVARGDEKVAEAAAADLKGPEGRMLQAGVEHMREPRELVEEVMYERVLTTRLRLQSYLPFIAICAASAPLLGLLGTVTGIINTFKMITLFGSGDVKSLSGGISEALITTKFGLIVAIPSLLLHAFLSRKAKSVVDGMEKTAIAFVNRMRTTPEAEPRVVIQGAPRTSAAPDPELVRQQVSAILGELLEPLADEYSTSNGTRPQAAQTTS